MINNDLINDLFNEKNTTFDLKNNYISYYEMWIEKYNSAKEFMNRVKDNKKILIECAAQHPLVDGVYPNEEFSKRLDLSIELYKKAKSEGNECIIYVPGSLHMYNKIADKIPLCEAGKNYLISKGIEECDIMGNETNIKYKGEVGCYNSGDECYIASRLFKDENFSKILSVVSPAQMYRKTLFYIYNGVIPLNYSAPTMESFHNYIDEMFNCIPNVLFIDHDLQGEDSKIGNFNRKDRNPNLN